jgi:hypothetical protein
MLIDQSLPLGRAYQEVVKSHVAPDINVQQMQLNLLSRILRHEYHETTFLNLPYTEMIKSNCPSAEPLSLELLTKDDISKYFELGVEILNEAVLM